MLLTEMRRILLPLALGMCFWSLFPLTLPGAIWHARCACLSYTCCHAACSNVPPVTR